MIYMIFVEFVSLFWGVTLGSFWDRVGWTLGSLWCSGNRFWDSGAPKKGVGNPAVRYTICISFKDSKNPFRQAWLGNSAIKWHSGVKRSHEGGNHGFPSHRPLHDIFWRQRIKFETWYAPCTYQWLHMPAGWLRQIGSYL